ncbi:hypothetical protein Golax_016841 [Gossypium laxum]|uniref:DUF4283 domain-containing protein n=1 Tax=Gossypium laxum TaxID=34288 RepID=A0A7J8YZP3_9ROSI|nr:hypothetical protein [Gossypium laxum]
MKKQRVKQLKKGNLQANFQKDEFLENLKRGNLKGKNKVNGGPLGMNKKAFKRLDRMKANGSREKLNGATMDESKPGIDKNGPALKEMGLTSAARIVEFPKRPLEITSRPQVQFEQNHLGAFDSSDSPRRKEQLVTPTHMGEDDVNSIFLGALQFNTTLQFNPTFDGLVELVVELSAGVLNPGRHSTIYFKENSNPKPNETKNNPNHNGRSLNKTIQERGSRFKLASNSRVPLLEMMNSMAKLINTQIQSEMGEREKVADEFKLDIVGLDEMRVGEGEADSIVVKLWFQFSHHVESIGFLEGIWISWKESLCVETEVEAVLGRIELDYSE